MPGVQRKKQGRPPYSPTANDREMVERLAGLLVAQVTIANDFLKIDEKTLVKHFRSELDNGKARVIGKLKSTVYIAAIQKGSLRAACYLLDRLGVWPQPTESNGLPKIVVYGGTHAIPSLTHGDTED